MQKRLAACRHTPPRAAGKAAVDSRTCMRAHAPPTHRLQGDVSDPDQRGIVPRAVEALGEGIAADDSGAEYEVTLVAQWLRAHGAVDGRGRMMLLMHSSS